MNDVYWEITTYDKQTILIPPAAVEVVKRRWDAGQPVHTERSGSVAASNIKSFLPTSKQHNAQPLLEAAAQAFGEPILNPDGSIVGRWVKKQVTNREYAKHYGSISAYKRLGDDGSMVSVGFFLPVDSIDVNKVEPCSDEEVRELDRTYRA